MNNVDDHSVTIDLPEVSNLSLKYYKVQNKRNKMNSQKKLGNKSSEGKVIGNYIFDDEALPINAFTIEGVFLSYKLYAKRQTQLKNKQKLAISIYDKYKFVIEELRKRLQVDNPSDDVKAIKDVDVEFFSSITDRPIFQYAPPFKSLRYLFNKQLRLMQALGYTKDNILKIVENGRKEGATYEVALKRYVEQAKYLNSFISDDYNESMKYLIKCDELVLKVNDKVTELQSLATEQFAITSRLIGLNYLYAHHQKYGRFLYYLSPPLWRLRNREFARSVEIEAKGFDLGIFSEDDTFIEIFDNMKKECAVGLVRPALYFSQPNELMENFDRIEKHQLNYYTHVVHMAPHTKCLKDKIKLLKDDILLDTVGVVNDVKSFERILMFYEDVCNHLKAKFFKLTYGPFYASVGSFEVLKLKLHLEFCYERVYLDKPINLDIVSIARALENFYMDYNKRLDAMQTKKVKGALSHNFKLERNKFKKAKAAGRELQLFNRLEQSLRRAYEPIVENQLSTFPPIKLGPKHTSSAFKRGNSQCKLDKTKVLVLTEAEKEYLSLFTDWTDNEDPADYLHSLRISKEEKISWHSLS